MKSQVIGALVALTTAACGSVVATRPSELTAAGGPTNVCSVSNLPTGWVVVAHSRNPTCGSLDWTSLDYWNQYTIEEAGDYMTVCSDSPIPSGYVKKSPVRSIACVIPMGTSFDYTNAYVIEKL
jgi:hypothetical protein